MLVPRKKILEHVERKVRRPVLLRELMRSLGISKHKRKEFRLLLKEMVDSGEVARVKGNRYGIPVRMNLVPGRLQGHPDGFGFVIPDQSGEQDIFVPRRNMSDAMHGDHVVARVESSRPAGDPAKGLRREGSVIQVLGRAARHTTGLFEWGRNREFGFVVPTDRRNWYDLYISPDHAREAQDGDLVVAEIIRYPTSHRSPEGRVTRTIGRAYDPRIDTQMIMAEFSLPIEFPEPVLSHAKSIPDHVSGKMRRGLSDLRGLKTVTIDGETARDFDDAVSIERINPRGIRLWVHIADVSSYVPWGSALDLEARKRGTSVYFPDFVVPMFPERLSNGICSLNPGEDRLVVTVEMQFDSQGQLLEYEIYPSVIQSDERMTYTNVAKILIEKNKVLRKRYHLLLEAFELMEELSDRLRTMRMKEGSIDFDLPEPEIILDLQGRPLDIVREEQNIAHKLIEEFMISANRAVGSYMSRRGIPCLYRIHEPPDSDKIHALSEFVSSFGHSLRIGKQGRDSGGRISPKILQRLLEEVRGRPEERLMNHVVLRSMKQARYSVENVGHFGLAAETYTHFTSPIRRYPDLIVHRLVKEAIGIKKLSSHREEALMKLLPDIGKTSSERERIAMEAEREVVALKKVRFMEDKTGEEFFGFITGVTAFGLFVELEKFFVEGLVHIASIPDDYYVFLEKQHCLLGRHHRKRFRIADRVKVRVDRVDLRKRRVDFTLVEETIASGRRRRKKQSSA